MPIPSLPHDADESDVMHIANALHSFSIHLLRRARAADKRSDLTPERLSLLSVIAYGESSTISQLSAIEGVSPPAISRSISSLEQMELVSRTRSKNDTREVMVRTTAKGRRLMEAGRMRRLEAIAAEIGKLDQDSLNTLSKVVDVMAKLDP